MGRLVFWLAQPSPRFRESGYGKPRVAQAVSGASVSAGRVPDFRFSLFLLDEDRAFDALLVHDITEKALHGTREAVVREAGLQERHGLHSIVRGAGGGGGDASPAEAVADEMDRLTIHGVI